MCLQGSRLQVECSFDEAGQYTERGKEWDSMSIDSVSVLPSECDSPDSVYTISAENLSAVRITRHNLLYYQSPCYRRCMIVCWTICRQKASIRILLTTSASFTGCTNTDATSNMA